MCDLFVTTSHSRINFRVEKCGATPYCLHRDWLILLEICHGQKRRLTKEISYSGPWLIGKRKVLQVNQITECMENLASQPILFACCARVSPIYGNNDVLNIFIWCNFRFCVCLCIHKLRRSNFEKTKDIITTKIAVKCSN